MRNSQIGAYIYPVVPAEFTNWRREQKAWRETAVLFDQSHHMVNLFMQGPRRAQADLATPAINSVANFPVEQGQAVRPDHATAATSSATASCSTSTEDEFVYVGRAPAANWLQFHGETGGYDVEIEIRRPLARRARTASRSRASTTASRSRARTPGRSSRSSTAARSSRLKFFHMGEMTIAGQTVRTLRHGMAGAPGLEIWGPYDEHDEIRDAILEAGEEFGLEPVGSRAYSSNTLESGWIPSPLPAIYTGEALSAPTASGCRPTSYEATNALAGSFVSDDIEDYYLTPWELGYGPFVKFDHDFIGRDALEKIDPRGAAQEGHARVERRGPREDLRLAARPRGPELPVLRPAERQLRLVELRLRDRRRRQASSGCSMFTGYSANERRGLSLATVDPDVPIGTEVQGRLGRAGRRHAQDDRRAARADRGPRDRQPGALLRGRARVLPGRLADEGRRHLSLRPEAVPGVG